MYAAATPTDANHESGVPNTYQYVQSTDTTGAAATPNGDYVLFANQTGVPSPTGTGTTFIFTVSAPGNGYLNGFEIVDHPLAAPTAAPVLSPGTAAKRHRFSDLYLRPRRLFLYGISFRPGPPHAVVVVATNVPTTFYTDTTVTNGVTYTYTVAGDNTPWRGASNPTR